ncbi:MAG: hypothetical protein AVDCRST_MAG83-926, partial [uncultured Arthrobacter sp.]
AESRRLHRALHAPHRPGAGLLRPGAVKLPRPSNDCRKPGAAEAKAVRGGSVGDDHPGRRLDLHRSPPAVL